MDAEPTEGLRVLVVEDDEVQAFLVSEALSGSGFSDIRVAGTAHDAQRELGEWKPDLLILDLGLPDGDGLTILEVVNKGGTMGVPVLVVTAESDPERRVRALELGADDLVTKPFNLLELGVRAQRALRTRDHLHAADVLARSLALELTELTEELELNHRMAVDVLLSSLSLRSSMLGTRARRVARSVHQLAVAVHLDDVAEHLGHAAGCHEIGALTLSDADVAAVEQDDAVAGQRCAIASTMILADRHVLAAAAARFRAPADSFERQIERLAAQLTAVCHVFHVAAATAEGFSPTAGVDALRTAEPDTLDADLVEAFLDVCVPATTPLD
ncbi:MAG: response regulator transcription factor [Ilumatobacteraceae bacterium]